MPLQSIVYECAKTQPQRKLHLLKHRNIIHNQFVHYTMRLVAWTTDHEVANEMAKPGGNARMSSDRSELSWILTNSLNKYMEKIRIKMRACLLRACVRACLLGQSVCKKYFGPEPSSKTKRCLVGTNVKFEILFQAKRAEKQTNRPSKNFLKNIPQSRFFCTEAEKWICFSEHIAWMYFVLMETSFFNLRSPIENGACICDSAEWNTILCSFAQTVVYVYVYRFAWWRWQFNQIKLHTIHNDDVAKLLSQKHIKT